MARLQGEVRAHVASGVVSLVCARYQVRTQQLYLVTTVVQVKQSVAC
jgi:ABC-type transport system involved in cytochrome c biogenesis permease subunit